MVAPGGAVGLNAAEETQADAAPAQGRRKLRLVQFDLGKVQSEPGKTLPVEKLRTDKGLRLTPGSSLWIDLKGAAESYATTVQPEPGSGTTRVESREVVFRPPDLAPTTRAPSARLTVSWALFWHEGGEAARRRCVGVRHRARHPILLRPEAFR